MRVPTGYAQRGAYGTDSFEHVVKRGVRTALLYRKKYIDAHDVGQEHQLTVAEGTEAMKLWKADVTAAEGHMKKNSFWAHVDRICVSKALGLAVLNAGHRKHFLVSQLAGMTHAKFSAEHLRFVETNRVRLKDHALMTKRRLLGLRRKLRKQRRLSKQGNSRAATAAQQLAELVADAQSAFDAVKRRAPDLFRNAGAAPSSKRSRRR